MANYKKMSMLVAKSDLDSLLTASKSGPGDALRKAEELGPVNGDRARDLLLNAEAAGIQAVVVLMETYKSDLEVQTLAMRICLRMLLGTHVQHGQYLRQVKRIEEFGKLGIVKQAVQVVAMFPHSPQAITSSLWLLSLMTQNVENAREAGKSHINPGVANALKGFAVFGKASPGGQKWGCACVMNLCKNLENRQELEAQGVPEVVGQLLDNSKSVMCDAKCVCSVLGAITEVRECESYAFTTCRRPTPTLSYVRIPANTAATSLARRSWAESRTLRHARSWST